MTQAEHNVDPNEVRKFEDLAHRWWDPNGEFRPLHDINPLRLHFVEAYAQIRGKRVLDVGCGGGILTEAMAQRGARATGIDMADGPLSVARLHLLESGLEVEYRQTTPETLADEAAGEFDVVTCMEMLEHVPDPTSIVTACARLVRPGGHVFFSTINRNPKAFLLAIVGAEYLLRLLPKGTHEYRRFITPAELDQWARAAGLEITAIQGMSYNPISQRYSLSDDVEVNYLVHARKD